MKLLGTLLVASLIGGTGLVGWHRARPEIALPQMVSIPAGEYLWRPSGNWQLSGRRVGPPLQRRVGRPLEIMKYQVTGEDYARCVADGDCSGTEPQDPKLAQVFVNWNDAVAYADWLSDATGQIWRLPTEEEWQRAAAERFVDDTVAGDDPGQRMLAAYSLNTAGRDAIATLEAPGSGGENSFGVADMAGPVWEWTSTCIESGTVEEDGGLRWDDSYCGARIAAGQHRARVIDFVRDPRAGGCGLGVPPDFLGIRLVREARN